MYLNVYVFKDLLGLPFIIIFGRLLGGSEVGALVASHSTFLMVILIVLLYVRWAHKRPGWSVALPKLRLEGWNLGMGFLFAWLTLVLLYALYALLGGVKLAFEAPDLQKYLPFMAAAIFAFLIQTSAEELTFRGYFMQALRRFITNPVIIIVLIGLIFAIPHLLNLVGMKLPWYAVVLYWINGSLWAWLAYRSRSLWMPIGWHWGNNLLLTTFIGEKNSGDVVQWMPLIVADKIPVLWVLIAAQVIASLVSVLILAWLIKRREKSMGVYPDTTL